MEESDGDDVQQRSPMQMSQVMISTITPYDTMALQKNTQNEIHNSFMFFKKLLNSTFIITVFQITYKKMYFVHCDNLPFLQQKFLLVVVRKAQVLILITYYRWPCSIPLFYIMFMLTVSQHKQYQDP